jgi:hypothetical protein
MEIFGYEIKFAKATKTIPTSPVSQYPVTTQSQGFTRYVGPTGDMALSYEIIDSLYEKTIMKRIINKVVGDCSRMNYTVKCTDIDGVMIPEMNETIKSIDTKLTRKNMRGIFRDSIKYGTAFLYVQFGPDGIPLRFVNVHPKYLTPVIADDGTLTQWKYSSGGNEIILTPQEILCFADDPKTGELYGNSWFGPIMQILELLFNAQLNVSTILDRIAIPILVWKLDSMIEGTRTAPEDILAFMNSLIAQLEIGNDVGIDASIQPEILTPSETLIDFVPIIDNLLMTLGMQVGIPMTLMGMKGDNLSVSRIQKQSYLELIRDKQDAIGDDLVEQLYKPLFAAQGYEEGIDYYGVHTVFPILAVEEGADAIKWINPSVNLGLIDRDEGRQALGYIGRAIAIDDIEVPDIQPEVQRPGAQKPSDPSDVKEPTAEPEEDRDHDPNG